LFYQFTFLFASPINTDGYVYPKQALVVDTTNVTHEDKNGKQNTHPKATLGRTTEPLVN